MNSQAEQGMMKGWARLERLSWAKYAEGWSSHDVNAQAVLEMLNNPNIIKSVWYDPP